MLAIISDDPLDAYLRCADLVVNEGRRKSDMSEVQDLYCKIEFTKAAVDGFNRFVESVKSHPALVHGGKKAERAYQRQKGNITKPSYIGRMCGYPFLRIGTNSRDPIDQIDLLVEKFRDAPQSSNLSLIVYHPEDLRDAYRPGYVPCLSMIDVKYRENRLDTKFIFRSCDFAEVALFDIFYCMKLHEDLSQKFCEARKDIDIKLNGSSFFFSRAFTYNRKREPIEIIRKAASEFREMTLKSGAST